MEATKIKFGDFEGEAKRGPNLNNGLIDAFVNFAKEHPHLVRSDISTGFHSEGMFKNKKDYKTTTLTLTIKEPV